MTTSQLHRSASYLANIILEDESGEDKDREQKLASAIVDAIVEWLGNNPPLEEDEEEEESTT